MVSSDEPVMEGWEVCGGGGSQSRLVFVLKTESVFFYLYLAS